MALTWLLASTLAVLLSEHACHQLHVHHHWPEDPLLTAVLLLPAQGSARVIRCLQNQRDKLTTNCRVTLFDEEVRFSENIDFQYPMKRLCAQEVEMFCKDVPHGNGRVIRCLQVRTSVCLQHALLHASMACRSRKAARCW